jgi:hypothetical protein
MIVWPQRLCHVPHLWLPQTLGTNRYDWPLATISPTVRCCR